MKKPTIEYAIKLLESQYERDKNLLHIEQPIAHSLYEVWKIIDKCEERRKRSE